MSKTVKGLDQQTIVDIAIQEYGSVEAVFDIMEDNPGVNLQTRVAGKLLKIRDVPTNKPIADYYSANKLKPVSINKNTVSGHDFNNDFNNDFN